MKRRIFKSTPVTLIGLLIINLFCTLLTGNAAKALPETLSVTKSLNVKTKLAQRNKQGRFKVVYSSIKNDEHKELKYIVEKSNAFTTLAGGLNEFLVLPVDITVSVQECGDANAYYAPDSHKIVMCYELINSFVKDLSAIEKDQEQLYTDAVFAAMFVFFHETGHALIDVLELPSTGKEEDAVDQLATLILTLAGNEGEEIALAAAKQFALAADKQTNIEGLAFWDEHSLDPQRFYNIVCLLYGSNPDKYTSLVKAVELPEDRAGRCPAEYTKVANSWMTLLAPYVREENK